MKKAIFLLFFVAATESLMAQKPPVFASAEGAIRGYDAVAYFTEGMPVAGLKEFYTQWNGQRWYFSSAKNLELFNATPEQYAPQYGGYCAFGMSRGYKAETQPDAWTIVDGKLYLNYNLKVREEWNKNQAERITKANETWSVIKDK